MQLLNYQERAIICSGQSTTLFYVAKNVKFVCRFPVSAYSDLFRKDRMRLDTKVYS